jgi:hypothetical protein
MNWDEKSPGVFLSCAEKLPSPCCGEELKIIGSRDRGFIDDESGKNTVRIRTAGPGLQATSMKKRAVNHSGPTSCTSHQTLVSMGRGTGTNRSRVAEALANHS